MNQTIPLYRQVCSKFQGEMAVTEVDKDYERVFNFMNEETGLGKPFPFSWLRLVDYFEVGYNAQSCMIWEDAKNLLRLGGGMGGLRNAASPSSSYPMASYSRTHGVYRSDILDNILS